MDADARPHWTQQLAREWLTRGPVAWALWPISCLYSLAWRVRRGLYRYGLIKAHRLPVPVVVVGNVIVGGAGKTPTVIEIVRHLQATGWRPGVISRGHGRSRNAAQPVKADSNPASVGDEPRLIAQATGAPVVVARQRWVAGQCLLRLHPDVNVIVSDDGMQHWALARDLTVVVFDERQTGNGWLLPAGLLREPWPVHPLGHEALLVVSSASAGTPDSPWPSFRATRELSGYAVNPQGVRRALADIRRHTVVGAVAGIAQPDAFFGMLRQQGVPLGPTLALVDHASASALVTALDTASAHGHRITWLCTEKDAVKLFPVLTATGHRAIDVWAVPLVQTPEPAFFKALDLLLNPARGRGLPVSCGHGYETA